MRTRLFFHSLYTFGIVAGLSNCTAPELGAQCVISTNASQEQRLAELSACLNATSEDVVDTRLKRDLDILFLIDNSASMSPKQKVLAQNIPRFMQKIDATGANYHVGVITSDVGTLPTNGLPPAGWNDPRCNTFSGDDGQLQAQPCTARTQGTGAEFQQACQTLCPDSRFVPTDGKRYISKESGVTNVPSLKDAMGVELGPQRAFQCMALVGDGGCGVESPLEAARRALDGHLSENSGFLRDDSVLAVIFITDEDDCSVRMSQRINNGPATSSCDPNDPNPDPSCFNRDYRCLASSVQCAESMSVPGQKSQCVEKPNNMLEPLTNYVSFFARKRSADQLVLAGIWSPSILDYQAGRGSDGQLIVASGNPPSTATDELNRGKKASAACYNPDSSLTSDPQGFFGQAQLRLSSFVRKFDPSVPVERSICDAANYASALDVIADKIASKGSPYCLSNRPKVVNETAVCLVGYVDTSQPKGSPDSYLPQCSATCCDAWANSAQPISETGKDPAIVSACMPEATDCYCAVKSRQSVCSNTAVAGIWRKDNAEPPIGKTASFRCATLKDLGTSP